MTITKITFVVLEHDQDRTRIRLVTDDVSQANQLIAMGCRKTKRYTVEAWQNGVFDGETKDEVLIK
jgi:hypothetical protein